MTVSLDEKMKRMFEDVQYYLELTRSEPNLKKEWLKMIHLRFDEMKELARKRISGR
jgi:hypothetical protein